MTRATAGEAAPSLVSASWSEGHAHRRQFACGTQSRFGFAQPVCTDLPQTFFACLLLVQPVAKNLCARFVGWHVAPAHYRRRGAAVAGLAVGMSREGKALFAACAGVPVARGAGEGRRTCCTAPRMVAAPGPVPMMLVTLVGMVCWWSWKVVAAPASAEPWFCFAHSCAQSAHRAAGFTDPPRNFFLSGAVMRPIENRRQLSRRSRQVRVRSQCRVSRCE